MWASLRRLGAFVGKPRRPTGALQGLLGLGGVLLAAPHPGVAAAALDGQMPPLAGLERATRLRQPTRELPAVQAPDYWTLMSNCREDYKTEVSNGF